MDGQTFDITSLPSCDDLFEVGPQLGSGVSGRVYQVKEKRSGRVLAAKVIKVTPENEAFIREECRILTHLPRHENIVDLYEIYLNKSGYDKELWIVTELCGGTAINYVRTLQRRGEKVEESHIAYILKGLIKAIIHLHENRVVHRDIRGSNILLTKEGEVRLCDFGISTVLATGSDKAKKCVGSPSWMAPETIFAGAGYDNRVDVWALGVTAIELAEGKGPYEGMHPARCLFQIMKNPPPKLTQLANWSQMFNDFIVECVEKNPDNRPVIQEFLEHPLFVDSETTRKVQEEIARIVSEGGAESTEKEYPEVMVREGFMKVEGGEEEKILQEDLAIMEDVSEDAILTELEARFRKKIIYTFLGDILLAINPNEDKNIYGEEYHKKYRYKARSDNTPHIYAVADSAYQQVLHYEEPQQILVTGEAASGKTTSLLHLLNHLLFLGQGNACGKLVEKAVSIIHALGNAGTPSNPNSTRHILQTQISFTATGKTSGAIFWIYQLEKNRVTSNDMSMKNFHVLYYFINAVRSEGTLEKYLLEDKNYKILREERGESDEKYAEFERNLKDLGLEDGQLKAIRRALAAIFILGELEFESDGEGHASIKSQDEANAVADLLGLDQKKFSWALIKYCVIIKGEAAMRHHTKEEADEAKNVLAKGIYLRLVDWIVNCINEKLSVPRAIFGDKYTVNILDFFGFECHTVNTIDQLFINSMNEQVQYYYNQKVFAWEMKNAEEEEIAMPALNFIDNKLVMDEILSKPDGLMHQIDEATKNGKSPASFMESLDESGKNSHVQVANPNEFSIAHYTGKITYKAADVLDRNRDFLPPEMIETLRRSTQDVIQKLFTGLFTTTGNLTMHASLDKMENREGRWNTAFRSTNSKFRGRKFNTSSKGQFSQSRQMRTNATTFRAICLEILKSLTSNESNLHFVRCIRSNLSNAPYEFQRDMIRQQVKALGVTETIKARQNGYSYRVTFADFIARYKFLAFDFNENVEETKENCRLLLIRLKMEGWMLGKTKIFLKYCDKEYLSRMYGMNVRNIVKVQSMMRAFLTRRALRAKIQRFQETIDLNSPAKNKSTSSLKNDESDDDTPDVCDELSRSEWMTDLNEKTLEFIKYWFKKWKTQSMYQILLLYRSVQHRHFVYFCQQVHLFNQNNRSILESIGHPIDLANVDQDADPKQIFPQVKISTHKTPFKLGDIIFADNSHLCTSVYADREPPMPENNEEEWDSPLQAYSQKRFPEPVTIEAEETLKPSPEPVTVEKEDKECQTDVITNDESCLMSNTKNTERIEEDNIKTNNNNNDDNDDNETNNNNNNNNNSNNNSGNGNDLDDHCCNNNKNSTDENENILTPENSDKDDESNNNVKNGGTETRTSPERQMVICEKDQSRAENIDFDPEEYTVVTAYPVNLVAPKPPKYMGINSKRNSRVKDKIDNFNNHANTLTRNGRNDFDSEAVCELPKYKNPIKEMEEIFKTGNSTVDDDEPPYNFRAMLRKTNYSDMSYKKESQNNSNNYDFTIKKLKKVEEPKKERQMISTEIAPGLIIEGEVTDL